MKLIEAIILGIIQGLAEFLPISSSGHIEIGKKLLGVCEFEESLTFTIVVHFATVLSTLIIFRKDIVQIVKKLFEFKWNVETKFVTFILVSMIPLLAIGLPLKNTLENSGMFNCHILLVGAMLILTGILLLSTIKAKQSNKELSYGAAILIGLAQAIALLPGISRSGSTISTGLLLGIDRSTMARFSFLMVIPPILGMTLLDVKDLIETPESLEAATITPLIGGFIAAFVTGLLACTLMIKIVKKGKIQYFAYYCFTAGLIAIIAGWTAI